MGSELVQENRCAVCGRPLALTGDPETRDESLQPDGVSSGWLPLCPDCQDDLYYEPALPSRR